MKAFRPHLASIAGYPYRPSAAPIKLDQNESGYDLPPVLKERVAEELARLSLNRYPSLHADETRTAIARHEGWDESGVVVAPGSNLLIGVLCQAARRVLDVAPSFPYYARGAQLAATPYRSLPLGPRFELPVSELLFALETEQVFFLSNPHAPTGALFDDAAVAALAGQARRSGGLLVVDEAYHPFAGTDARDLARANPHVALLRTFSKAWGLGGVRAGYMLASEPVARIVQELLPPFGFPAHTAAIVRTVLDDPGYAAERAREVIFERGRVTSALSRHPTWEVFPSHTNFILVRTPDAERAHAQLLKHGIAVRRQDSYAGLSGCIRITIGRPDENTALLAAAGCDEPIG